MPFVSPGVYAREQDLSTYIPNLSSSIFGAVGTATWGPIGVVTDVTSADQMVQTFGKPNANHLAEYAMLQYFSEGRQGKYVRVAVSGVAVKSTVDVLDGGGTCFTVDALYEGTNIDDYDVVIASGTKASTFKLSVVNTQGIVVEKYDNLVKTPTSDDYYVATKINGVSNYVVIKDNYSSSLLPTNNTYTLTGGNDGYTGITDGEYTTGLDLYSSGESVDINLLACPGVSSDAGVIKLTSLAETRADCFALIDPPLGLNVSEVIDFHNGEGSYTGRQALDTSYAALHYSWLKIYDNFTASNIWVPPSGFIAAVIAKTDYQNDPWWAPAGYNRGRLTSAIAVEYSPTLGERDNMYSNGNAVNPIVNFHQNGITVWGQRTLQRLPTALDRINVRRLMLYMEKVVTTACNSLVFEPNDKYTWHRVNGLIEPWLRSVQSRRGIYEFKVVCDDTTNPPDQIDQNTLGVKVFVKPTKTAEMIVSDFMILSTGAVITEYI